MKNTVKLVIYFVLLFALFTWLFGCSEPKITEPTGKKDTGQDINLKIILTDINNVNTQYEIKMLEYDNYTKEDLLIMTFQECGEVIPDFTNNIKYFKVYIDN